MRIRSFKPEFWRDARLAAMPDAVRLFYMGLWAEADDAGWLRWNPPEIGADLYPYRAGRIRVAQVEAWGERLVAAGRLVIYECGHAQVPTLAKHQRSGGHPVEAIEREHRNQCKGEKVAGPGARPKRAQSEEAPPKPDRSPTEATREPTTGGEVRGGKGRGGGVVGGVELATQTDQPINGSASDDLASLIDQYHSADGDNKKAQIAALARAQHGVDITVPQP